MSFSFESTTDDVLDGIDLSGRRFVVTGAASGLGEESTRALAAHGASVLMLARDPRRTPPPPSEFGPRCRTPTCRSTRVDLADLSSVRSFAARYLESGRADRRADEQRRRDGLPVRPDRRRLRDAVRHEPPRPLRAHAPADAGGLPATQPRIVNLSSAAHGIADVDLDDPNFERTDYDAWVAYGRSKSANALHALALAQRRRGRAARSRCTPAGS